MMCSETETLDCLYRELLLLSSAYIITPTLMRFDRVLTKTIIEERRNMEREYQKKKTPARQFV